MLIISWIRWNNCVVRLEESCSDDHQFNINRTIK